MRASAFTGRALLAARAVWLALVGLALATWAATIWPHFDELRVLCAGEDCPLLALSRQELPVLETLGLTLEFYAGYQVGWELFSVVAFTVLAGVIFWRKSTDRASLSVSLALVMLGAVGFSSGFYTLFRVYPGLRLLFDLLMALAIACTVVIFYLFPDGRFVPRWTRWLAIILVAYLLIALLLPGGLYGTFFTPGPLRVVAYVVLFGCIAAGILAQLYRYLRVSSPSQRQQTKWVVFGLSAMVLGTFLWGFAIEVFPPPPGPTRLYLKLVGVGVIFLAILVFPLCLAIAILRYRLYDVDLVINRALVYGALTASLSFTYWGEVVLLQQLLRPITQGSDLAIVGATLAVAALVQPARRRIQGAVDRRFYRRKYHAQRTLEAFGTHLREHVELESLAGELEAVVRSTMQPASVSLWLRAPEALPVGTSRQG